jgi:hypothetical protein
MPYWSGVLIASKCNVNISGLENISCAEDSLVSSVFMDNEDSSRGGFFGGAPTTGYSTSFSLL